MLDLVSRSGREVISIGKSSDIFCGTGITESIPAKGNPACIDATLEAMQRVVEFFVRLTLHQYFPIANFDHDFGVVLLLEGALRPGDLDSTVQDFHLDSAGQRYRLPADTGEGLFLFFLVHSRITRQNRVVRRQRPHARLSARP